MISGIANERGKWMGTRRHSRTRAVAVAAALIIVVSMAGCASVKTPPGTSTASFFQNPDRVWAAIEISLDTLEYEIETSNRADGKMRAVPLGGGDGRSIALEIDQVAWSQDQVKIYVKPVAGDPGSPVSQENLDKAAADFLTVLKRKLGG